MGDASHVSGMAGPRRTERTSTTDIFGKNNSPTCFTAMHPARAHVLQIAAFPLWDLSNMQIA
ncbi:hypothetical protein GCM10010872_06920 [Dyella flava]|nr:hypothetical protein GCM10010872_06920 [Dyella flava]